MKLKLGIYVLSILSIIVILIYIVVSQLIVPRPSSPREIHDAWKRGEVIRVRIEEWKLQNGHLPEKLEMVLPSTPDDVYYLKQSLQSYSIEIRLHGRSEFLVYLGGPDFSSPGWNHSGFGLDGRSRVISTPYRK